MRITIVIDTDVINGCRLDIFEDNRYTLKENVERPVDVFKELEKWLASKISEELKAIKKSPTWEVI